MTWVNQPTNVNASMAQTTGIPMWIFVIVLTIITLYVVIKHCVNPNLR